MHLVVAVGLGGLVDAIAGHGGHPRSGFVCVRSGRKRSHNPRSPGVGQANAVGLCAKPRLMRLAMSARRERRDPCFADGGPRPALRGSVEWTRAPRSLMRNPGLHAPLKTPGTQPPKLHPRPAEPRLPRTGLCGQGNSSCARSVALCSCEGAVVARNARARQLRLCASSARPFTWRARKDALRAQCSGSCAQRGWAAREAFPAEAGAAQLTGKAKRHAFGDWWVTRGVHRAAHGAVAAACRARCAWGETGAGARGVFGAATDAVRDSAGTIRSPIRTFPRQLHGVGR